MEDVGGTVASTGPGIGRGSAGCVALGILVQVCYPLLAGSALTVATVLSVLLLATAAVAHAGAVHGLRAGLAVLVTAAGVGLLAEAVGTHTGYPFGAYSYATDGRLGPHLLGVPLVVPLAWTMLAYPALLLGRRLRPGGGGRGRAARALLGAGILTGWDLFLDPQMVAAGHWSWQHPSPALPGVPDVPLTNFAGWLVVGFLLVAVLDLVLPERPAGLATGQSHTGELVPAAVLTWTWLGSALGNLVFFDRPWVAVYGFLGMGLFVVPYLRELFARKPIRLTRKPIRPGVTR